MINGILLIVAAVLFAMVYLFGQMGPVWLWIAGGYLLFGILNLIVYALRVHRREKAAQTENETV